MSQKSAPKKTAEMPAEPDLTGAMEDLQEMVKKPKKISSEEVVKKAFEQIDTALKRGYSFTDIARVFAKRHVRISAKELKAQFEAVTGSSAQEESKSI